MPYYYAHAVSTNRRMYTISNTKTSCIPRGSSVCITWLPPPRISTSLEMVTNRKRITLTVPGIYCNFYEIGLSWTRLVKSVSALFSSLPSQLWNLCWTHMLEWFRGRIPWMVVCLIQIKSKLLWEHSTVGRKWAALLRHWPSGLGENFGRCFTLYGHFCFCKSSC